MKKILMLLIFLIFTGCSTVNKSTIASPISVSTSSEINANIKVGDKISGSSKTNLLLGFWILSGPTEFADGVFAGLIANPFDPIGPAKSAAAFDAISNSGADVIINPQYTVKVDRTLVYTNIEVTVTGYNGKIIGFN